MDYGENFVLIDSSAAEQRFLQGRSSTPSANRRLSASSRASALKSRNLIPPLHSPSDRRLSLPRAAKTDANMPTVADKRKAKQGEADAAQQPGDTAEGPSPTEKFIQEQLAALMAMITSVKADIGRAETRTVEKIDTKVDDLAGKLQSRMSKAESGLAQLGTEVAATRQQMESLKLAADERERRLPQIVEELVKAKLATVVDAKPGRRHQPLQGPDNTALSANAARAPTDRDDKYWQARRTLRLWPIPGADGTDLRGEVILFLQNRLKFPAGRLDREDMEVKRVFSQPGSTAQDQVLVTFSSIALRDEVKSMARNLSSQDRNTGVQIEAPDHLRSHYQAFQRLAFQLKRKHPGLRRNVKFYDSELSLTMDVKISTDSEWKSIMYSQAREILKKTRVRTESFSLEELEEMADIDQGGQKKRRRQTLADSDSDEDLDSTIIDLTDVENNKQKKPSRQLCFINTNARSLGPKVESLYDCCEEKNLDLALLTETWYQSDRTLQDKLEEYSNRSSLGALVRNRAAIANNGRQYGGVAFVFRKSTSNFEHFPLVNHDNHEVLAKVGKVHALKARFSA